MPANLTADYKKAEERLRQAVTQEERIAALEEMLRVIPKHKGTEKLQADLKSRLARLRREPPKKAGRGGASRKIPREGAGQVALVGPPNAGKSALVARLTRATPEVADYPMSTREATPGMMPFEDVSIQLVDLPPLWDEHVEPWVYDLARAADLFWLVLPIDAALEGFEQVERLLAAKAIAPRPIGTAPEAELRPGWVGRRTLMVLTGVDRPGAREDAAAFEELLAERWPTVLVSALTGEGLEELTRRTFEALEVIRVYCKEPGKEADLEQPFTVPRGASVEELARVIHRDFAEGLRFARVWGRSAHDGTQVSGGHELEEGDVVELHI